MGNSVYYIKTITRFKKVNALPFLGFEIGTEEFNSVKREGLITYVRLRKLFDKKNWKPFRDQVPQVLEIN